MESTSSEVLHEFRSFRVYKNGQVEKQRWPPEKIPPFDDPSTGIRSKDIFISKEPDVSARIFLPLLPNPASKLPVLVYMHGGGFSMESAFSPRHDSWVRLLVGKAGIIVVSVEYRLAPENPIPACYDDSWMVLRWVASHTDRDGPEPYLNNHGDFSHVFVGGNSAGGNISHTLAYWVGSIGLPGARVVGAFMIHPYFGGVDTDDRMCLYMCPTNKGVDDPRMKPPEEDLALLGCERVLVFVAERDHLREPGKAYCERLKKSGWKGRVELVENEGQEHSFHLHDPTSENAMILINKIVCFINQSEE